MRIRSFKPDQEQLPTEFWFIAGKYPVKYEMVDYMTVRYHFIFYQHMPVEEIVAAANKVFCRQPLRSGLDGWRVDAIEELNSNDPKIEKIIQVKFRF